MDKLADAILGADPSATGPEQKYALICARCHRHNGLALKEEFNEVQYVCPHCGHFNSRRPSSAPVSSPFNHSAAATTAGAGVGNSRSQQQREMVETPTRPSKAKGEGSRLKLRADEESEDDEEEEDDRPPVATLQDEHSKETLIDSKVEDSPRDARLKSLRARKSQSNKTSDGMDLDED